MEHHVTISSKGGKTLIKRHDINGWTLIDEKTFDSSDIAGMAAHTGVNEDHMKAALNSTSDQMVHLNAFTPQPVDDEAEGSDHRVVHGDYIGDAGGDRARADDSEHGVA